MAKRDEMRVSVYDLDGKLHELSRRNANDMVSHLGWTYQKGEVDPIDENAAAPRKIKPRKSPVEAKAEEIEEKKPKKRGKTAKAPSVDELPDDVEEIVPYDLQSGDEEVDPLDALEAEEDARSSLEVEEEEQGNG